MSCRGRAGWLTDRFLFHRYRPRAAGRALRAIPKLAYVDLQFVDGPAERIAMHSQLARSAALVAFIFLKHGEDKPLLELAHALGIEDVAFVHLQDECFQLIFHDSLSLRSNVFFLSCVSPATADTSVYFDLEAGAPVISFGARRRKSSPS